MFLNPVEARMQLSELTHTPTTTPAQIESYLTLYKKLLSPKQKPDLYLLKRKIPKDHTALLSRLQKIIDSMPIEKNSEGALFEKLAQEETGASPGNKELIKRYLKAKPETLWQYMAQMHWAKDPESLSVDQFIAGVLHLRVATEVVLASGPFFESCMAHGVNPFSLMYTQRDGRMPEQGPQQSHMAALNNNVGEMIQLHAKAALVFKTLSPLGGTAYDYMRARGHALPRLSDLEYPPEIKREYLSTTVVPLEIIPFLLSSKPSPNFQYELDVLEAYVARRKRNEQDPIQAFKIENGPLAGQWGLRATRAITMDELICPYYGHMGLSKASDDSPYLFAITNYAPLNIEGAKAGSLAELINHGPPKCRVVSFILDGLPFLGVMPLRPIAEGEEFLYSYRGRHFKGEIPAEIDPQGVDDYMSMTSELTSFEPLFCHIDQRVKQSLQILPGDKEIKIKEGKIAPDELARIIATAEYQHHMLDYILNFPTRLFENIKSGRIPKLRVLTLLETFYKGNMLSVPGLDTRSYKKLCEDIRKL